jgi:hypothetical protein
MNTSLTISLSREPGLDARNLLQIEQEDWAAYTGVVTRSEMVYAIANTLYGTSYDPATWCGLVDGNVVSTIYVYPRIPDLAYQLHTSWGSLSQRREATIELTEILNYRLTDAVQPDHPPLAIRSASWLDDCYDAAGTLVAPPALTIESGEIRSAQKVYGAVTINYTTIRHTYTLNQPRRETAIDNQYSAAVYGLYEGGINWLVLEMPPGIEAFEADPDAWCGWSGSGRVIDDDKEPWPVNPGGADRRTTVDYCTQKIISDEYDAR